MQVSDLCAVAVSHVTCGFGASMVKDNCPILEMSVHGRTCPILNAPVFRDIKRMALDERTGDLSFAEQIVP
jgi:hypothetical protein